MKLSQYAKKLGITYRSAWNHFTSGKIPNAYRLESGAIIVPDENITQPPTLVNQTKKVCIYARVSSTQNKNKLDSQLNRIEQYCNANGWQIIRSVKEIASGLNDNRTKLTSIIKNIDQYDLVVIEHKDRLTRIGFNYFNLFYPNKFHVINETDNKKDDLMEDFVAIVTSFCARLYGQRKGKRKTEIIIEELTK